jgi:hypothetical protein
VALAGPSFVPQIGLRQFCGEAPEADPREPETPLESKEESNDDEHP